MSVSDSPTANGLDRILSQLREFEQFEFAWPQECSVSEYLHRLTELEVLPCETSEFVETLYQNSRYGGAAVDEQAVNQALHTLQAAQQALKEANPAQVQQWLARWEKLSPPHRDCSLPAPVPREPAPAAATTRNPSTVPTAMPVASSSPSNSSPTAKRIPWGRSLFCVVWTAGMFVSGYYAQSLTPWRRPSRAQGDMMFKYSELQDAILRSDTQYQAVPFLVNLATTVAPRQTELSQVLQEYAMSINHPTAIRVMHLQDEFVRERDPAKALQKLSELAELRTQLKQYAQAIHTYQKILELAPDDVSALCGHARLLLTATDPWYRDKNSALQLAERARALSPTAEVLDVLAEAQFQHERLELAVELEERAIALNPAEARTYNVRLGRFKSAISNREFRRQQEQTYQASESR